MTTQPTLPKFQLKVKFPKPVPKRKLSDRMFDAAAREEGTARDVLLFFAKQVIALEDTQGTAMRAAASRLFWLGVALGVVVGVIAGVQMVTP